LIILEHKLSQQKSKNQINKNSNNNKDNINLKNFNNLIKDNSKHHILGEKLLVKVDGDSKRNKYHHFYKIQINQLHREDLKKYRENKLKN
jgi:hypothetical protein